MIVLCVLAAFSGWGSDALAKDPPFKQGEKMIYQARWRLFPPASP